MAKKGKRKAAAGDVATNRQASYRFNLLERFECGIVLTGTEVKSLREGQAQLKDSYAVVRDGEVHVRFPRLEGRTFLLHCLFRDDLSGDVQQLLGLHNTVDLLTLVFDGTPRPDGLMGCMELITRDS